MPVSTGIGAQLGYVAETTYGTFAVPTKFLPFDSESLRSTLNYGEPEAGFMGGVLAADTGLVVQTTRTAGGSITAPVQSKGWGGLLNLLHGNTVTPTGAGDAKTQTHVIGTTAPDGKSATFQVGIPDTAGAKHPKSLLGGTIANASFEMETGGFLSANLDIAGKDVVTSEALATATYPAGAELFGFKDAVLEINASSVGACVRSASVAIALPKDTERFCLNGDGTAQAPLTNEKIAITGSMTLEFTGLAQYNAYLNSTRRAVTLECETVGEIETGVKASIKFDMPTVLTTDGVPMVSDAGIVMLAVEFRALANGATPPLTITYVSSDTAV